VRGDLKRLKVPVAESGPGVERRLENARSRGFRTGNVEGNRLCARTWFGAVAPSRARIFQLSRPNRQRAPEGVLERRPHRRKVLAPVDHAGHSGEEILMSLPAISLSARDGAIRGWLFSREDRHFVAP
jgi:hypothetical protein